MTCPRCKCPECAKAELNAVLSRRIVSREAAAEMDEAFRRAFALLPRYLRRAERLDPHTDQSAWRDTVEEGGR